VPGLSSTVDPLSLYTCGAHNAFSGHHPIQQSDNSGEWVISARQTEHALKPHEGQ
jgi:hypothetical protein